MDTLQVIEVIGAAVGGGVGYKILSSIFGYNTSKIKSLTDIIDTMDARMRQQDAKITAQDERIDELEKKVEDIKEEKISVMTELEKYKYAATFRKQCKDKAKCPMYLAFKDLEKQ